MRRPLDNFREQIAETAWAAAIHCQLIAHYTDLRDDVGLRYTIDRLIAYTKAVASIHRDMVEARVREHERGQHCYSKDPPT